MKQIFALFCLVVLVLTLAAISYSQNSPRDAYREGRYEGTAFNATAKQRGSVLFELYDLDRSTGRARAYFGASNGLVGEAWLNGKITGNGELDLSGQLASFTMEMKGHLSPSGDIVANYKLEGADPQEGTFDVTFKNGLSARNSGISPDFDRLIGAWEVGGALPAQVNPVTGLPTGISFVDAHRLEFLPDGQFKHIWTHRHCEARIKCCSEQAKLEEGEFSLSGSRLHLAIAGGTLIGSDNCNPKLNGHTPVAKHEESFVVTIKNGFGSQQLCLQSGSQPAACYQKQP